MTISFAVIAYQAVIFISIVGARYSFGAKPASVVVGFWVLWTLLLVTLGSPLQELQFATILVASIISFKSIRIVAAVCAAIAISVYVFVVKPQNDEARLVAERNQFAAALALEMAIDAENRKRIEQHNSAWSSCVSQTQGVSFPEPGSRQLYWRRCLANSGSEWPDQFRTLAKIPSSTGE